MSVKNNQADKKWRGRHKAFAKHLKRSKSKLERRRFKHQGELSEGYGKYNRWES